MGYGNRHRTEATPHGRFHPFCSTRVQVVWSPLKLAQLPKAQKEGKSESELDEMWWKQAGELVAGYYKQREEVEKDVEGLLVVWVFMFFQPSLSS